MNNNTQHIEKTTRLHPEISRWFVIYTKYKTEKFVLERLQKKGIKAYLPLLKYSRRYTRKIKHFEVPLINCYVFVKIKTSEYIRVLETEYVSGFLKNRGSLLDVKEEEIETLRKVVGESTAVSAEAVTFEPGQAVEIIAGNLTGLKGRLVEKKGRNEFVVVLESIGYQLRLSIPAECLAPVH